MQAGARACKAKHVHPPHIQMCSCIYVCMTTFTGPHAHIDCFFFQNRLFKNSGCDFSMNVFFYRTSVLWAKGD